MLHSARTALLIGLLLAPGHTAAQEAPGSDVDVAALEARRGEVAAELEALREAGSGAELRGALQRLERALAQLIEATRHGQELAVELESARPASLADVLPAEGPPYPVAAYDAALSAVSAAERVLEQSEDAARVATTSLETASAELEELEREARAAGTHGPDAPVRLEVASRLVQLRRVQLANARRAVSLQEVDLERQRQALERIAADVRARPGERDAALEAVDRRAVELGRQRDRLEQQLAAARRQLERVEAGAAAEGELAARRAEVSGLRRSVALLAGRLDRLDRARKRTESRFALFSADPPDRATIDAWREESRAVVAALSREAQLDRAELAALSREVASTSGAPGPWREQEVAAHRRTLESYAGNLESLEVAIGEERALQLALKARLGPPGLTEQLRRLGSAVSDLWSFELGSSEDRSVTVGKIVIALLTFVIGVFLAGVVTRLAFARLMARVGVDEGAAHAYQSLSYYVLVAIAFLIALRFVDIPLTAFAVVGGALAIGVGFGSQNVVNNFISGVILLAERPIKRGDLVDVDGTYGNVEKIGLRSTRIRTGDNIHVIVPNAAFLENKVVNWTHNDAQVRLRLGVGVIYGSPTRDVERLILQALHEHERVLKAPEPLVLFTEFGDNSLNFEARFWVRVRSILDRLRVESDLRYRIDDLFRESDLVIAFPQRDVHLDATAPLPIQLVDMRRDPGEEV